MGNLDWNVWAMPHEEISAIMTIRHMHATKAFLNYVAYKRACAAECTAPVTYGAWLWLRGFDVARPW